LEEKVMIVIQKVAEEGSFTDQSGDTVYYNRRFKLKRFSGA
jgi:hypothetical protein